MGPQCFRRKDSEPPACGVHDLPLMKRQSSDDPEASFFGEFEYLVCPVSGYVVSDASPPIIELKER
jgi:hypothetical protein